MIGLDLKLQTTWSIIWIAIRVKVQKVENKTQLLLSNFFGEETLKKKKMFFTGLVGVLFVGESTSGSLDDFCRSPDAALDTFGQRLFLGKLGDEATDKRVPGAVRVDDLEEVQVKWEI